MARWICADPSGFKDGPNLNIFGGNPVNGFDRLGLWYDSNYTPSNALNDYVTASLAVNGLGASGFSVAQRLGDYSLSRDPVDFTGVGSFDFPYYRSPPSDEPNMLQSSDDFNNIFTTDLFRQYSGNYEFTQLVSYSLTTDAGLSYGRVLFTVSGVVVANTVDDVTWYSTNPLFTFDDRYDFDSSLPGYAAFARLQFHDIIYNYVNTGEFFGSYAWE